MSEKTCQREFEFVLILSGVRELTNEVENALFEAGCDDATLSVRYGRVALSFDRKAATFKDAVLSAIRDVRRANIGAMVARIDECNLVSPSEIARRMGGRSRQLVHQYITGQRGPGNFPAPECQISQGKPLWLWSVVADWLYRNGLLKTEDFEQAETVWQVNDILNEQGRKHLRDNDLAREVREAIS